MYSFLLSHRELRVPLERYLFVRGRWFTWKSDNRLFTKSNNRKFIL